MFQLEKRVEFDDVNSDTDSLFFNIECPGDNGKSIELYVVLLTDETKIAFLEVNVYYEERLIFDKIVKMDRWEAALELSYSLSNEYIHIFVNNSEKDYTLQIKVQDYDPAIFFDMIEDFGKEGEEFLELGYLAEEDCNKNEMESNNETELRIGDDRGPSPEHIDLFQRG